MDKERDWRSRENDFARKKGWNKKGLNERGRRRERGGGKFPLICNYEKRIIIIYKRGMFILHDGRNYAKTRDIGFV